MILAGLAGIIVIEIYAAVMQREFQNTDNRVGKGFAILGIYLFVVVYCMSAEDTQPISPYSRLLSAINLHRWYAQQYHLAIRRRGSAHCAS